MVACAFCEEKPVRTQFPDVVTLEDQGEREHDAQALSCIPFYQFDTAFQNIAARYMLVLDGNDAEEFDFSTLFEAHRPGIEATLENYALPLRFVITLRLDLTKVQDDDAMAVFNRFLNSHARSVWTPGEERFALSRAGEERSARLENSQDSASG